MVLFERGGGRNWGLASKPPDVGADLPHASALADDPALDFDDAAEVLWLMDRSPG
jgi:hypothetical protein